MNYFQLNAKYIRSLFFFYNREQNSINGFSLCKGQEINVKETLIYNVKKIDDYISDYDYLPVSCGPPLVSKRFRNIYSEWEKYNQIQYYKARIIDDEGNENSDYFALNILSSREGLDLDKSITDVDRLGRLKIKKLALLPDFMDNLIITRLAEKTLKIISNEVFKDLFKKNNLKGISFKEEGYSMYTNI